MNTKKLFAIIYSIMCSFFVTAQTEQSLALLITKSNGVTIGYRLSQFPVLSFENEMLNVSYEGSRSSFPWNEVKSLSYVNESDIQDIIKDLKKDNDYSVVFFNNGVSISTNKAEMIKIFDVNGTCQYSSKTIKNYPLYVDFSFFTKGLYILSVGNNNSKNTKFYVK